jgi:hypothetical protein
MPINIVVVHKHSFLLALAYEHKKYGTFDDLEHGKQFKKF